MLVIDEPAQRERDAVVPGSGCATPSQTQRLMIALYRVFQTHRIEGQ